MGEEEEDEEKEEEEEEEEEGDWVGEKRLRLVEGGNVRTREAGREGGRRVMGERERDENKGKGDEEGRRK